MSNDKKPEPPAEPIRLVNEQEESRKYSENPPQSSKTTQEPKPPKAKRSS